MGYLDSVPHGPSPCLGISYDKGRGGKEWAGILFHVSDCIKFATVPLAKANNMTNPELQYTEKDVATETPLIMVIDTINPPQFVLLVLLFYRWENQDLRLNKFPRVNQPSECTRSSDILTLNMFFPPTVSGMFIHIHRCWVYCFQKTEPFHITMIPQKFQKQQLECQSDYLSFL